MKKLQEDLKLTFKDPSLLERAFTHRSYLNEHKQQALKSNERLEFLGDAVLELAVSSYLYRKMPNKPEGELTALRSSLVKTETLHQVAVKLSLGKHLKMSRGELASGGKTNTGLLANTVEAVIGAIYLDRGFEAAETFISTHILPKLKKIISLNLHHDFKSTLQEKVQSQGLPTPIYRTVDETGPDHLRKFNIEVTVNSKPLGTGTGLSKQKAQQQAARDALAKMTKI